MISLSGVPLIYGEETDEETYQMGFTSTMDLPNSDKEPPEIIE